MVLALRIILVLGGSLLLFIGVQFLIDPAGSAADFGIDVEGAHGLTSIRADFTAFFGIGGLCLIWGSLARHRYPLIIGGALMLVPLSARVAGLAIDGSFEGYIPPMVVEAVLGISALIGAAILPKSKKPDGVISGSF